MKRIVCCISLMTVLGLGGLTEVRGAMDSFESLKPLCDKNIFHSCFKIGERFRTLDRDEKKALPYYEKACEGGHFTACSHAGIVLMKRGTPYSKEFKRAAKLLEKACAGNHDKACYNMGSLKYKEGRQKKAIKYFQMACDLNNAAGCARAKKLRR